MRSVAADWERVLPDALDGPAAARIVVTDRRHGDLAVGSVDVDRRRRAVVDAPWSWLHQVHGAEVVVVHTPGSGAGEHGDALVATVRRAPIAVQVADCAPVALVDPSGVVAIAHAGWRGVRDGVLTATIAAMRRLGASAPTAVLGPCIRPDAYEFGERELDELADAFGPAVRSTTSQGRPALDLPAAVAAALAREGVELAATLGGCTAAEADDRWSHRARGDRERQAMVIWVDDVGSGAGRDGEGCES